MKLLFKRKCKHCKSFPKVRQSHPFCTVSFTSNQDQNACGLCNRFQHFTLRKMGWECKQPYL